MKRNEELEIQIITQQKENEAKEAQLSSQLAESQNTISELKCGWLCGVTCSEKSKALGDSISRMTVELAKKEEASQSSVSELEALKGELEEAKSAKGAIQAEMVEKEKKKMQMEMRMWPMLPKTLLKAIWVRTMPSWPVV